MEDKEAIEMMARASSEIKNLRAQNDALRPKADAYDNMAALIGLLPRTSRGASEDVAWLFDKRIRELTTAKKEPSNGGS